MDKVCYSHILKYYLVMNEKAWLNKCNNMDEYLKSRVPSERSQTQRALTVLLH